MGLREHFREQWQVWLMTVCLVVVIAMVGVVSRGNDNRVRYFSNCVKYSAEGAPPLWRCTGAQRGSW